MLVLGLGLDLQSIGRGLDAVMLYAFILVYALWEFVPLRLLSDKVDRCFATAGPKLWNSVPVQLRQADISYKQFKRLLKTFFLSGV